MTGSFFRAFSIGLLCLGLLFAAACAKPSQPPLPVGNLKLGLTGFTQPKMPSDMLAGYQVEDTPTVEAVDLHELDGILNSVLAKQSRHSFIGRESAERCRRSVHAESGSPRAALRTWSAVGRCMGADLLVVPQIMEYRKRDGGPLGVVTPARVVSDIFIVDVRNETLISRSRFDETQSSLTGNLLDTDKFLKRGAHWITAAELAREGMEKAVKELGL
ncbi:MAG: hypothetical protein LBR82_08730 [Desulfovibrio sp.]|jgi:hypothetical protein|nr:hypothetical protein [Desulfovibrio sp.]